MTDRTGNCHQCGHPGYLYEQETEGWLCDACTAIADMHHERDAVLERETRRRGHPGHNDPKIDYTELEVPA